MIVQCHSVVSKGLYLRTVASDTNAVFDTAKCILDFHVVMALRTEDLHYGADALFRRPAWHTRFAVGCQCAVTSLASRDTVEASREAIQITHHCSMCRAVRFTASQNDSCTYYTSMEKRFSASLLSCVDSDKDV